MRYISTWIFICQSYTYTRGAYWSSFNQVIYPGYIHFYLCCCQVVWQKWTNQISIFLFRISINLFRSWHTIIRNKLMRISLSFMNVSQLRVRNKFMLMWNKNIFIWFVHFCQTTWQQHLCTNYKALRDTGYSDNGHWPKVWL